MTAPITPSPPIEAAPPQSIAGAVGRAASLTADVTIFAGTRANRADFMLIHAAVDQADIQPLQVVPEPPVVEARHNYSFNLGTQVGAERDREHANWEIERRRNIGPRRLHAQGEGHWRY